MNHVEEKTQREEGGLLITDIYAKGERKKNKKDKPRPIEIGHLKNNLRYRKLKSRRTHRLGSEKEGKGNLQKGTQGNRYLRGEKYLEWGKERPAKKFGFDTTGQLWL